MGSNSDSPSRCGERDSIPNCYRAGCVCCCQEISKEMTEECDDVVSAVREAGADAEEFVNDKPLAEHRDLEDDDPLLDAVGGGKGTPPELRLSHVGLMNAGTTTEAVVSGAVHATHKLLHIERSEEPSSEFSGNGGAMLDACGAALLLAFLPEAAEHFAALLCALITRGPEDYSAPLFLLAADGFGHLARDAAAAGITAVLPKPVSPGTLMAGLARCQVTPSAIFPTLTRAPDRCASRS